MLVSVSEGLPLLETSLLISSSVQRSELSCTGPVLLDASWLTASARCKKIAPAKGEKWKKCKDP